MPLCSSCQRNVDQFARGGGPANRLCNDCASDEPQGRGPVVHPHGEQYEEYE